MTRNKMIQVARVVHLQQAEAQDNKTTIVLMQKALVSRGPFFVEGLFRVHINPDLFQ